MICAKSTLKKWVNKFISVESFFVLSLTTEKIAAKVKCYQGTCLWNKSQLKRTKERKQSAFIRYRSDPLPVLFNSIVHVKQSDWWCKNEMKLERKNYHFPAETFPGLDRVCEKISEVIKSENLHIIFAVVLRQEKHCRAFHPSVIIVFHG